MSTTTIAGDFPTARGGILPPKFGVDPFLCSVVVMLVSLSLVMVYSTTGVVAAERFGDTLYYVKRQGVSALLGLVLMVACAQIPLHLLRSISPYLFVVGASLLILTLLPSVGDSAGGAHRWVRLGPLRFQPGELVKLMFVVFMAGFFARHERRIALFSQGVVKPALLFGVFALLYLAQPDFGSVVVLFLVTFAMGLSAGVRPVHLAVCGVAGVAAMLPIVFFSPYRMRRVTAFLSPFADPAGKGYQLIQSLIAVGSGGLTGVGIGNSQQKLFFLPAAHTDFIFAVVGEELGFLGCAALLALFCLFFYRGIALASAIAHDTFAFSLSIGLTLLIVVPAFLNTGVVTGLLPTKGMVLPLLGYGGSSLVASLSGIGLLLAATRGAEK